MTDYASHLPGADAAARLSWTLRGTWLPAEAPDRVRPAELRLFAERPTARELAQGHLHVRGRLDLEGWLAAAPVSGTLAVLPGLRVRVRYSLQVATTSPLTLDFALRPRLSQPIDSVTRLWAEIAGPHGSQGLVHLRFDVRRDLAPHLLAALRGAPSTLG